MDRTARIMVIGPPGSGKSTYAIKLARQLSVPVFHIDKYQFVHNWGKRDYEEFLIIQRGFVAQEKWVIEGCGIKSFEMRYARADVCLYLDLSRNICLYRLLKRRFTKDHAMDDRPQGCDESLPWHLVKYLWNFRARVREQLQQLQDRYPEVLFLRVRSKQDIAKAHQLLLKRYQS